jgi:hypothetical protein
MTRPMTDSEICDLIEGLSGALTNAEDRIEALEKRVGALVAGTTPVPDRWTSLRDQITRDAATEQELGDGYGDMGTDQSWDSANKRWGKAEALREVLATMDRMEAGK